MLGLLEDAWQAVSDVSGVVWLNGLNLGQEGFGTEACLSQLA